MHSELTFKKDLHLNLFKVEHVYTQELLWIIIDFIFCVIYTLNREDLYSKSYRKLEQLPKGFLEHVIWLREIG